MKIKQTTSKTLSYLGAAISKGQPISGTQLTPDLIRNSGLFKMLQNVYGVSVHDYGNISLQPEDELKYPPVPFAVRDLNVLGPLLGRLHWKVNEVIKKAPDNILLNVGGDHSVGAATISGIRRHYSNLRVVWVDAHPDCTNSHMRNPQKLYSQNYHGMPLSHLTGITSIPFQPYWSWLTEMPLLDPRNVVLLAIRDIDRDQYDSLKKHGIKCFTMDHIDQYGIGEVMRRTIEHLDPRNDHPFHISFDIDAMDPQMMNQTGTRFRYGLSGRQGVHIIRRLAHERKVVSMDLVQINPRIHPQQPYQKKHRGEQNLLDITQTVGMGCDLVSSLFTRYFQL